MSKLRGITHDGHKGYRFWCPGCNFSHLYLVEGPLKWDFNNDMEKPTFHPSLLTDGHRPERRCHLFVTNGKIHFCGDCFHELKGKVVDMVEMDDETGAPK